MRILLTIGLIIIATCSGAYPNCVQDSVKVDKRKVEKLIKQIKKWPHLKNTNHLIKDFDKRKITFSYPDKFLTKRGFVINVLHKGEVILMYFIERDTYEFGEIIDLR